MWRSLAKLTLAPEITVAAFPSQPGLSRKEALKARNGQCPRGFRYRPGIFIDVLHGGANFVAIHGDDFIEQLGADAERKVSGPF